MTIKNKSAAMVLILFLSVSVTIVALFAPHISKDKKIIKLGASWSYRYGDLEEITTESDLIALIEVANLAESYSDQQIPMSTYNVKVISPIYNADVDSFEIKMTGMETDDVVYEVDGDPLLKKGEEFLVFCNENDDGSYRIIGGPQGRLTYADGKLNSLITDENDINTFSAETQEEHIGFYVIDADADSIIQQVKGYIGSK